MSVHVRDDVLQILLGAAVVGARAAGWATASAASNPSVCIVHLLAACKNRILTLAARASDL
jgi:hypothetical protein